MYEDKKKKGGGKKKGSAKESDAQKAKNLVNDMPVDEVAGASKGKKHHKKVVARKKGAAQYKEEGAADFKGGLHAKNTKHSESGEHLGAKRMGFTQNFGAARQNSYAQGAAKVASIMSFGASKYMKHGAADAGHGESAGHKHDPVSGSSANFSADDETGAKLTQSVTTKSNVPTPNPTGERKSGSPEFSKAFGEARKSGVSTFNFNGKSYNTNLASDEKPKVTPPAITNTTNTLDENQTSKNQIKREGLSQKQSLVGQLNMNRYADEMQAVKDSTAADNRTFSKLLSANSNNLTPSTLSYIERHSANQGNIAANETRTNSGLPIVKRTAGTHDQYKGSIQRGDSDVPAYPSLPVKGKVDKSRTVLLPNERATFTRTSPLYIPIPK